MEKEPTPKPIASSSIELEFAQKAQRSAGQFGHHVSGDQIGHRLTQMSLSDQDDIKSKMELLKSDTSELAKVLYTLLYEPETNAAAIVYLPTIPWESPSSCTLLKTYLPEIMKLLINEAQYPNPNRKIGLALLMLSEAIDIEDDTLRNDLVYCIVGPQYGGIDCLMQRLKTIVETEHGLTSDSHLQHVCGLVLRLLNRLLYRSPRKTESAERILSSAGDLFPLIVSSKSPDILVDNLSYLMYLMRPTDYCFVDPEILLPYVDSMVSMFKYAVKRSKHTESVFHHSNKVAFLPAFLVQWILTMLDQNEEEQLQTVASLRSTDFGHTIMEVLQLPEPEDEKSHFVRTCHNDLMNKTLLLVQYLMSIATDARPTTMLCTVGVIQAVITRLYVSSEDDTNAICRIFVNMSETQPLLLTRYTKPLLPALLCQTMKYLNSDTKIEKILVHSLVTVLKQLLVKSSIQTVLWIKEEWIKITHYCQVFLHYLTRLPDKNENVQFLLRELRQGATANVASSTNTSILSASSLMVDL